MSFALQFLIFAAFSSIGINNCVSSPLVGPKVKISPKNAYPFIVSIQRKIVVGAWGLKKQFFQYCGGSLITRKHVLTAAHCFGNKLHTNKYKVIVGSNDLQKGQVHHVKTWLKYDTWAMAMSVKQNKKSPDYTTNDIAIVKLVNPVNSNINQAKITKASNDELRHTQVMTAGWGRNDEDITPRYMLEVNLIMISRKQCIRNVEVARNFTKPFTLEENFFCTNGDPYAILHCGDSGSPLFWNGNEVIGINYAICPKNIVNPFSTKEQNIHLDARLYFNFISAVTDNCSIENSKSASSCWPF